MSYDFLSDLAKKRKFLSPDGLAMDNAIALLVEHYNYKKLPSHVSVMQRQFYMNALPEFWKDEFYKKYELFLKSHNGSVLATGVSSRGFVCGDYGVFLEMDDSQINRSALMLKPGEEYRLYDVSFKDNVKYVWYTDKDNRFIKFYHQQKGVTYADYQPGKWYVSPYEIVLSTGRLLTEEEQKRFDNSYNHMPDASCVYEPDLFVDDVSVSRTKLYSR